ncbi:phage baseplate assembly protein V [Pseudomonas japonica]|uniref:phage baseplate assembly protein V n=1 Tax=Pseudomonas japonica TaxID=256466 RepID=UPI0015E30D99|nr:phage baseplate assembly protein V [Pseudomonas japonica]MBA1289178.1 phage baseplate assembly protein V [Pseudomonas japonica]
MDPITELNRAVENLIRGGVIAALDAKAARCRVATGGLVTGWLPFFQPRAGEDQVWDPPSLGEQCVVLSPSGRTACGLVLVGLFSELFPAPDTSLARHCRRYRDGAEVSYDTDTHLLTATLPSGGQVHVEAPGGLSVIGNVRIEGSLAASEDVTAGPQSISLINHPHGGVKAGPEQSGAPLP